MKTVNVDEYVIESNLENRGKIDMIKQFNFRLNPAKVLSQNNNSEERSNNSKIKNFNFQLPENQYDSIISLLVKNIK